MSFCTTCGKYVYRNDDHYCAHCGSPIEQINNGEFTEKQIEAFNDPIVSAELWNTEEGRWMLKEVAKEGLIKDPRFTKLILES